MRAMIAVVEHTSGTGKLEDAQGTDAEGSLPNADAPLPAPQPQDQSASPEQSALPCVNRTLNVGSLAFLAGAPIFLFPAWRRAFCATSHQEHPAVTELTVPEPIPCMHWIKQTH